MELGIYLRAWLVLVASMRLVSVYFGYVKPSVIKTKVYPSAPVTDVHARTFATWTMVTCVLCLYTVYENVAGGVYKVTMFSFVAALVHFLLEFLVYKTMTLKTFLSPAIVATTPGTHHVAACPIRLCMARTCPGQISADAGPLAMLAAS
eukprot:jgi/Mesvir1/3730/Mv15006-RA.1